MGQMAIAFLLVHMSGISKGPVSA